MKKITLFLLLLSTISYAQTDKMAAYLKGMHYQVIEPEYSTEDDKQIIIYEFFGYKCPHCADFQPYMKSLHSQLPKNVKVIRVPLGFNPSWKVLAQGYYTAEALGVIEKSHIAMFDALHKQRKKMRSIDDIADWYASEYQVDKGEFLKMANSFMIDSKIKQGNNMARDMKVPNTPKLVINGKFMPMVTKLGSNDAVIELTLALVEQENKLMKLK